MVREAKKNKTMLITINQKMKWENPSVGLYNVVLVDVIDKGVQTVEYNGERKQLHKVRLLWETEEKTSEGRR